MYPLNTVQPWPSNQWYIAGFSRELEQQLIGRTILGKKMVLFRDSGGVAHALSGICPHRMMPLELGTLDNDTLVCGYHGLGFDTSGKCVATPTSSKQANCSLQRFPLQEAGPLLWVWPGEPEKAADTPLPDQASIGIGKEGWHTECVQRIELKARYQILIDNLFDLSHLGFVHASIVGSGGIALIEPEIEERNGRLIVSRLLSDVPADDYHRFLHPHIGDTMSVGLETDLVGVGLLNAGGPAWNGTAENDKLLGHMNFIHGITPETPSSTHYYSILARDFRVDDIPLTQALAAQNVAVIQQDVEVLEEIESLLQSGLDMPREVSIGSDQGGKRARRYLVQLIEQECKV